MARPTQSRRRRNRIPPRRPRGARRDRRRGRSALFGFSSWLWLCAAAAFIGGVATGVQLKRLDHTVTQRFEGRLFRVPSRVYSAPAIVYPGLNWRQADLLGVLVRLGYREAESGDHSLEPGQVRWGTQRARVHLRAFSHPRRSEPNRDIELRLAGNEIESILELPQRREVAAVLLEPEFVGAYYGLDRAQRELVRLGDVPQHLIDAVLAIEDQRFLDHHGIDPLRVVGAFLANLRAGGIAQGGSTLTQQLVKNFFLTSERTYRRKTLEAVMALLVELRYSKELILEAYLNEIYLGQRGATAIHGVGEASRLFFGKSVRDLSVAEATLIAGIIHSPNGNSPYRDRATALARRNLVLKHMWKQGRLDEVTYNASRSVPLRLAHVTHEANHVRYFSDALRQQLPEVYDAAVLENAGLRIYSTLDTRLQRAAAAAVNEGLAELERRYPRLRGDKPGSRLEACLIALRPQTGEIVAMVGGRDYGFSQYNRCTQARRQPGSAFKPFVYAAALEPVGGGPAITLANRLDDSPFQVKLTHSVWQPQNYDHEYHGNVSPRSALENSYNVATARLGHRIGIDRVIQLARRLGIESHLPAVPSLALGVAEVTPLELARAYATFANGGIRPDLRMFEDLVAENGRTLARRDIAFERALDAGTAYLMTSLLEGVVDRGTGAGVRATGLRGAIAGKTGTTNDTYDAWFAGYTPELVAVVWVGFDEPKSHGLTGASGALPIWIRFVQEATGGEVRGAFFPPTNVVEVAIDPISGRRALSGCPARETELFLLGTEPVDTCPGDGLPAVAGHQRDPAAWVVDRFLDWLRRAQ